jgi:hypothetical protein
MYKTNRDKGNPNLNSSTPKIPLMALPQSPPLMSPQSSNMDEHRSFTMLNPSLPSSSSPAPTPKPSTSQPLKSILKGKALLPRDSYEPQPPKSILKGKTPLPRASYESQSLKSILKGKAPLPRDSYESDREVTATKKGSRDNAYTVPNFLPQRAHFGESLVQLMLSFHHYVPYLIFHR